MHGYRRSQCPCADADLSCFTLRPSLCGVQIPKSGHAAGERERLTGARKRADPVCWLSPSHKCAFCFPIQSASAGQKMQWHLRHPKLLGSGRRVQATRSHHSNETTCDRVLVGTSLAHYGESLTSHPVNSHIRSKSRRSVTTETPRRWAKGRLAPVSASRPVSTIRDHISLDRVVGDSVARSRSVLFGASISDNASSLS